MGRDVAAASGAARQVYERASSVLGFDLAGLCFDGPAERLEQTDVQQPAILVTSLALWAALQERGVADGFDFAAGLSLGEYTALHVCGAVAFEDVVRLVHQRGCYMQEAARASASGMVSLMGLEPGDVEQLCREAARGQVLQPANFNCPGQIVVSGDASACDRLVAAVEAGRGKAVKLKVAGAFHSPLMQPAAVRLQAALAATAFGPARPPVLSNVDARPHGTADQIRDRLQRQLCSPVRWQECIERLIAEGIEEFVEIGPGRTLTGMMRKIDRGKTAINVSTAESLEQYLAAQAAAS
jgi:[acyl-carrier-protein] S-malonyltransferase